MICADAGCAKNSSADAPSVRQRDRRNMASSFGTINYANFDCLRLNHWNRAISGIISNQNSAAREIENIRFVTVQPSPPERLLRKQDSNALTNDNCSSCKNHPYAG